MIEKKTIEQYKILQFLIENQEYAFSFQMISDNTGLSKEEIKKHITGLRNTGLVEYHKGLLDDEGQAMGSGYSFNYGKHELAHQWLSEFAASRQSYDVKNPEVEKMLRDIAGILAKAMPKNWGFALLMFDYTKPDSKDHGSMFYISSAERSAMIEAMKEFITKQEAEK